MTIRKLIHSQTSGAVGIHVPAETPQGLVAARERYGVDFFAEPGETRDIATAGSTE